jgi:hypothetical protein
MRRFHATYPSILVILLGMKRIVRVSLAIVAMLVFLRGQQSDALPQNEPKQSCPDTIDTIGRYVNSSYGFSIVIPTGLKGAWNSGRCGAGKDGCVCMSDHGRIIPLATGRTDSDHWIEASAGFATELDEPTPQNAVDSRLGWIRERSRDGSVLVLQRSDLTIGGIKGKRVVVRYYDKKSGRVMVEDFVEALRDKPDVEYSLYLRTTVEAYERDKAIFDQVLTSFALTECDC